MKRTILVVDDDARSRYLLRRMLTSGGYDVVEAGDGVEALERARAEPPALVVSDLLMPRMDGFAFCRAWMSDDRLGHIPFVVHTATYTSDKDRRLARDLGAARYLIKPLKPGVFLREVEAALAESVHPEVAPSAPTAALTDGDFRARHEERLQAKLDRKLVQVREADARLEVYVRRCEAILDTAPDAIISVDPDRRIQTWNRAAEALFGYGEAEIVGQPVDVLIPEDQRALAHAKMAEASPKGRVVPWETIRLTKDGRAVDVAVHLRWLGASVGHVAVVTDISERRRVHARLKTLDDRFRRFLASSPTVLYSLAVRDGAFIPAWVSDNLDRVFGHTVDEALAPGWWSDHLHPDDRDGAVAATTQLLAEGHVTHEYRFRARDGAYRTVLDELVLVRESNSSPAEVFGTWVDVTEVRHAAAERDGLRRQLEGAQRMEAIGRLAGGVAHDFNNVLTVVTAHAGFVAEELRAGDPMRADAEAILDAARHASGLTRQLLAFSRRQPMQPRILDPNRVLRSMASMFRRLLGEDVALEVRLTDDIVPVEVDESQIEQVILNLVVNARDAMPTGGRLVVETGVREVAGSAVATLGVPAAGRYVQLSVSDTGVGMDEATRTRIFEPFFTTKEPGKGTGLGLATAYGVVTQSGGAISVDSHPGQGTRFDVLLPVVDKPISEAARGGPPPDASGRGETVLVVEDEPMVRRLAGRILRRSGYRVVEAANGGEALLVLEEQGESVDLLLTDVVMPGMSGRVLAARVRRLLPDLKVIYTSGYTRDIIEPHGVTGEGVTLLPKPYSQVELTGIVRAVLDGERPGGV